MKERDVSKITTIFVHHSASEWGDADTIRQWHLDRGWSDIGYNDVILNCYPDYASFRDGNPNLDSDGTVEDGRDIKYIPAGVRGHNTNSIHICLIGNKTYSSEQIIALKSTIQFYKAKYPSIQKVLRHADMDDRKPECPGLSGRFLRELAHGS